jgi:hypothetical protein
MPEIKIRREIRPYQSSLHTAWVTGAKKRGLEIAHRRWGKDEIAFAATCELAHKRIASYWHCLPEYEQGRKALWTAINPRTGNRRIDEAFPPELRESKNEQEMFIKLKCGSTWQLVGSDRYNSLVGAGVAGVVFSEWALANPSAWGYIRPMIEENGGWAYFITTPRGRNHAHSMLEAHRTNPNWFCEVSTINDTGALTPDQIIEAKADLCATYGRDIGLAQFEQEYLCSFNAATLGSYYGRELAEAEGEGRICDVAWDPHVPTYTAWDLGKGANMAVWFFQIVGQEIHVIDYHEGSHSDGIPQTVAKIKDKGYPIAIDWVPHDAKATDIGSGRTRIETFKLEGRKPRLIPDHKEIDGINAARVTLPRCWFDTVRCAGGIEALRQFHAEWDDERKCFRETPFPDWTNHPADAFRYLAMAWREIKPPPPPKPPGRDIHHMTLDELYKMTKPHRPGIRI